MKPLNYLQVLPVLLIGLGTVFASCWDINGGKNLTPPQDAIREEAYIPVYGVDTASLLIKAMPPQPIIESGKIYVLGNLLFQVENLKGIHVINYANRQNPVKMGFIKVRGCSELAVKGNHLITNNMNDLVTIDISKTDDVKEVARIKNAFPYFYAPRFQNSLPPGKGYFRCPVYNDGDVISWKLEKNVKNADCYNP